MNSGGGTRPREALIGGVKEENLAVNGKAGSVMALDSRHAALAGQRQV